MASFPAESSHAERVGEYTEIVRAQKGRYDVAECKDAAGDGAHHRHNENQHLSEKHHGQKQANRDHVDRNVVS